MTPSFLTEIFYFKHDVGASNAMSLTLKAVNHLVNFGGLQ